MDATTTALLSVVVLAAFTTEATVGFGSLLIALTLASVFMPTGVALSIVVPLEVGLAATIVVRHGRGVAWRPLMLQILPLMILGGAVGFSISTGLSPDVLRRALGGLVVTFSVMQLARSLRHGSLDRPLVPWLRGLIIAGAGLVHGMFATGGPLLVYAIGRSDMAKTELRSTLAMVWLILNSTLTATYLIDGRVDLEVGRTILLLSPIVVVSIVLGEILHQRIPERPFRILIFSLLLASGLLILIR